MTTVGEFLNNTRHLIKRAEEYGQNNAPVKNNNGNGVQGFLDRNPWLHPMVNTVMKAQVDTPFGKWDGPQVAYNIAHSTQPTEIYTGSVPSGDNRYVYLADRLFGTGNRDKNPYLEYFKNRPANYNDSDFMYDLHRIMKSNPNVSSVIMRNVMAGDPLFADLMTNEARLASETDPEGARAAARGAQYLYKQLGTLGKTLVGPEVQGRIAGEAYTNEFDRQKRLYSEGRYGTTNQVFAPHLFNKWEQNADNAHFEQYADDYNQNIFNPEIADKRLEHNFYGKLQDPGVRNAVRYATPWLTYGVPLAAGASMLGNNDLWGPVGLGLAGSSAYGYASGNGYVPQIGFLDNFVSMANKPIANLGNSIISGFPLTEALVDTVTPPNQNTPENTPQNNKQSTQQQSTGSPQANYKINNNPYQFNTNIYKQYV